MSVNVIASSHLTIDGTCVKFEEATGYVDALDIFYILTSTTSAAYRLTSQKFKLGANGIKRVRWDVLNAGLGRIAVRHDVMCRVLLEMKGGKTTAAKKVAEAISERFGCFHIYEQQAVDSPPTQPSTLGVDNKDQSSESFIYGLFSYVHNRIMYTGRTLSPGERMKQHGCKSSKCRLVRQGFREHGSRNFSMRILMRCSSKDAKENESLWIVKNKTMYPEGYNLVHGVTAGQIRDGSKTISPEFASSFEFNDYDHEKRVLTTACSDLHLEMMRETTDDYVGDDLNHLPSVKSKRLVENEVLEDKIKRAKSLGDEELVTELKKRFFEA